MDLSNALMWMTESAPEDVTKSIECELSRREAEVERRVTLEEVALWLAQYHGKYREKTLQEWVQERREVRKCGDAR